VSSGETNTGLRAILARPAVYALWARLVGGERARTALVHDYIRPHPGARILDLGCGPADLLPFLGDVSYVGIDHSAEYIESARARHGARADLRVGDVGALDDDLHDFDIVTVIGVLHHIDDASARRLFASAAAALKPGGRCVALDGTFVRGQSRASRAIIRADRGQHVRTPPAYAALADEAFTSICTVARHDLLRMPYTHCILVAAND
jgi:SAM-dependent methyltransferase